MGFNSLKHAFFLPANAVFVLFWRGSFVSTTCAHSRIALVDKVLLDYFVTDLQVVDHIEAMRDYFFMANGNFAQNLTEILLEKVIAGFFLASMDLLINVLVFLLYLVLMCISVTMCLIECVFVCITLLVC